jgi:hypothetical protein
MRDAGFVDVEHRILSKLAFATTPDAVIKVLNSATGQATSMEKYVGDSLSLCI